jgi:hypothetical protein
MGVPRHAGRLNATGGAPDRQRQLVYQRIRHGLSGRNAIQSLLGEVFCRLRLGEVPSSGICEVGPLRRTANFDV